MPSAAFWREQKAQGKRAENYLNPCFLLLAAFHEEQKKKNGLNGSLNGVWFKQLFTFCFLLKATECRKQGFKSLPAISSLAFSSPFKPNCIKIHGRTLQTTKHAKLVTNSSLSAGSFLSLIIHIVYTILFLQHCFLILQHSLS